MGSYSVKLLSLHGAATAGRHAIAELPLPRRANGEEPPAAEMARLLGDCLARAGQSARGLHGVTLGVSGPDVIVKQISLPLMDESEVAGALRFEARKHLPFDPQTMVIDFQVLGRYPGEKRLDVLLAAVSQQRVERALAPLRELGVEADIVDAAPLALTNALAWIATADGEARVLLDLGHSGSWLTLWQRGAPYFTRRLEWGGLAVTQAIAAAARVPLEEAEEWKLEAGSDEPSMRVRPDAPEMQAVRSTVAHLADEIRRSFAFYRTLGPLPEPLTLWLSGNTARLPGIAGQLSEALGAPVLVFNPLDAAGAGGGDGPRPPGGPQFAQAFGLALRAT